MARRFLIQTGGVLTSVMLMLGIATAAEQQQLKNNSPAHHFLTEAAQGSVAEVTLGKMAAEKGENAAVKDFGNRMVRDHSKAIEEAKVLATTAGVPLPTEMSEEAKALQQRLNNLAGVEFDRAYMDEMVNDHKKDIAAFEKQAEDGQNAQVKEWAKKMLPTLKEHLNLAQSAEKRVSARNRTEMDASGGMRADVDDIQGSQGQTKEDR